MVVLIRDPTRDFLYYRVMCLGFGTELSAVSILRARALVLTRPTFGLQCLVLAGLVLSGPLRYAQDS